MISSRDIGFLGGGFVLGALAMYVYNKYKAKKPQGENFVEQSIDIEEPEEPSETCKDEKKNITNIDGVPTFRTPAEHHEYISETRQMWLDDYERIIAEANYADNEVWAGELEDDDFGFEEEDDMQAFGGPDREFKEELVGRDLRKEPYFITPNEFYNESYWGKDELIYYEDSGEIITEMFQDLFTDEERVWIDGCDWEHNFGQYEDDTVFIRNEDLGVDYKITKVPGEFVLPWEKPGARWAQKEKNL